MYWPNGVPQVYAVDGPVVTDKTDQAEPIEDNESGQINDTDQVNNVSSSRPLQASKEDQGTTGYRRCVSEPMTGLCVSRNGYLFATMTDSSIAIWQTRPTVVVAMVRRSENSLKNYGCNKTILLRADAAIVIVQTLRGYLITYSIATDQGSEVYQQKFANNRRHSLARQLDIDEVSSIREVSLRFRVAIKIDAGISKVLALENELMIATTRPAAIQLIRWTPDGTGRQTSTELLSRVPWFSKKAGVVDMVYDRAMSIFLWITTEGEVYAVQRKDEAERARDPKAVFKGHRIHTPENGSQIALKAAVNARFSLFAISCISGEIYIYAAKDYMGNNPLSHKLQLPGSPESIGTISSLTYSPDGYCLFAGYENGWTTWSVFGKPGGTSFGCDRAQAESNKDSWMTGVLTAFWIGGGSAVILICPNDHRLFMLDIARSSLTGCFSAANLSRALIQTEKEIIIYRGHDLPDLTTISGKDALWHHAQFPPNYLHAQWPIRICSASQDGRYVAVAGRRGLAHYSVNSGRWKTYNDSNDENSFSVQGGMCWYGHILIAAVECDDCYELRLLSRELSLSDASILFAEVLPAPAVFIGPSGEDSLLVYTYDNVLYHYVINATQTRISLVQVGQIAFHGIVRAPTRVRSISWILPDNQLRDGDPSQDVSVASVLFLVDGKLVLLQPSLSPIGELKYDMRIIANDVEYYILMRDQLAFNFAPPSDDLPPTPSVGTPQVDISLRDSLWIFCGRDLLVWSDVREILRPIEIPKPVPIPVDFYPLSILLNKGIALGAESEMSQRRDVTFMLLRFAIRSQLFLPYLLQHHLAHLDTPSALSICHYFSHLPYFPHALEIMLHHVLDDEVDFHDSRGRNGNTEYRHLLPGVLSFLQLAISTEQYLDILVQCIRKTELRSWRTLFDHLPKPHELYEQALRLNSLKTAGGYLLVVHAFDDENDPDSESRIEDAVLRLLKLASDNGDWELCAELARFLVALDPSGKMLKDAVIKVGLRRDCKSPLLCPNGSSIDLGLAQENLRGLALTLPRP